MFRRLPLVLALVLGLTSCSRDQDGQGDYKKQISDYISKSFTIRAAGDRTELMTYLTGDAKARLAAWSDDQFKEAFIDAKRQFVKLAFKEIKPVSQKEVNVTYELTYLINKQNKEKDREAKVTNKKLCQMVLEQGKWLISDVKSIKELVEYRNEMSLP